MPDVRLPPPPPGIRASLAETVAGRDVGVTAASSSTPHRGRVNLALYTPAAATTISTPGSEYSPYAGQLGHGFSLAYEDTTAGSLSRMRQQVEESELLEMAQTLPRPGRVSELSKRLSELDDLIRPFATGSTTSNMNSARSHSSSSSSSSSMVVGGQLDSYSVTSSSTAAAIEAVEAAGGVAPVRLIIPFGTSQPSGRTAAAAMQSVAASQMPPLHGRVTPGGNYPFAAGVGTSTTRATSPSPSAGLAMDTATVASQHQQPQHSANDAAQQLRSGAPPPWGLTAPSGAADPLAETLSRARAVAQASQHHLQHMLHGGLAATSSSSTSSPARQLSAPTPSTTTAPTPPQRPSAPASSAAAAVSLPLALLVGGGDPSLMRFNAVLEPMVLEAQRVVSCLFAGADFVAVLPQMKPSHASASPANSSTASMPVRRRVHLQLQPDARTLSWSVRPDSSGSGVGPTPHSGAFKIADITGIHVHTDGSGLRWSFFTSILPPSKPLAVAAASGEITPAMELLAPDRLLLQEWVTGLTLLHDAIPTS